MTPPTHAMALLAAGVPLSLLCDLADPAGPDSLAILHHEKPATELLGDLLDAADDRPLPLAAGGAWQAGS